MRANGANRATFLRESNFIVWKVFELSALSSHQSGRAFVAAENVYTPREGGDDRNYKNTIGHGSTIVAIYAATLHKILPSPPLYPWNGVSTTICESVNADFSFQYCRRRAITQPPLPLRAKTLFCTLLRIVSNRWQIAREKIERIISIFASNVILLQ